MNALQTVPREASTVPADPVLLPTARPSLEARQLPLSAPSIGAAEEAAVLEVLRSGRLSLGPKLLEFEKAFAAHVGRKHAIAVSSGTAGLHLCVRALGIGPGDEVITTPFSFIASSNCLLYEGAVPIFADIDPVTLCIEPSRVEALITPRTKAILAVDVFGHPADWDALEKLADRYQLALLGDCCEALGSQYYSKRHEGWRMAGSLGDAAVFAFYPNKQITTGEGGMIVTDSPQIAASCYAMRNQGRMQMSGWLDHYTLGYNYRLGELSCALGLVQLSRVQEIMRSRERVAELYLRALSDIPGLTLPMPRADSRVSWFVFVVRLSERYSAEQRDEVMADLQAQGVGCANYFPTIHLSAYYRKRFGYRPGDYPISEFVSDRTIALPFYGGMTASDVRYVSDALRRALARVGAPATMAC